MKKGFKYGKKINKLGDRIILATLAGWGVEGQNDKDKKGRSA